MSNLYDQPTAYEQLLPYNGVSTPVPPEPPGGGGGGGGGNWSGRRIDGYTSRKELKWSKSDDSRRAAEKRRREQEDEEDLVLAATAFF